MRFREWSGAERAHRRPVPPDRFLVLRNLREML
jgi:hypothetical protein